MRPPEPYPHQRSIVGRFGAALRNNFFAGVVVIAPIGLTVWLIWTAVGWVDGVVMPFVPRYWHPDAIINRWIGNPRGSEDWIEIDIRGVGVVVFLIFTVIIGWTARGLIGRSFLRWGEDLVGRVPVIRSIYNAVKQIAETVFNESDAKFDRPCLVEFPRRGVWSLAFMAAPARGEVRARLSSRMGNDDIVALFRPNTPNPATGFLIFVHRSEIIELDMGLEDAAKLVISAGLVYPGEAAPDVVPPAPPEPRPDPRPDPRPARAPLPVRAPGE